MPSPPRFLIIDSDDASRDLLRWTLLRMYPLGETRAAVTVPAAVDDVRHSPPRVVIVHRASDGDSTACVKAIRAVTPDLPIVVLSASDAHAQAALAAGATEFLKRDEWLRLRTLLDKLLADR